MHRRYVFALSFYIRHIFIVSYGVNS